MGGETNLTYVLSFVLSGDGGSEAQKTLSLLGLLNSTSMKKANFSAIEDGMYGAVKAITEQAILASLVYPRWRLLNRTQALTFTDGKNVLRVTLHRRSTATQRLPYQWTWVGRSVPVAGSMTLTPVMLL